jgi:hypothetical protein
MFLCNSRAHHRVRFTQYYLVYLSCGGISHNYFLASGYKNHSASYRFAREVKIKMRHWKYVLEPRLRDNL